MTLPKFSRSKVAALGTAALISVQSGTASGQVMRQHSFLFDDLMDGVELRGSMPSCHQSYKWQMAA